jgi:hypothetical protein
VRNFLGHICLLHTAYTQQSCDIKQHYISKGLHEPCTHCLNTHSQEDVKHRTAKCCNLTPHQRMLPGQTPVDQLRHTSNM